ncbi:MAG: sigma-70 family RNA polymerase sigma factor [Eubacteriales bacterium]|nr:sigma-70 family RNA polymerase sigma factor [Eubacteriales bacterium]
MSECLTKSADPHRERSHYGLAVSCAKRFMGRGVPMEELIGEAEAALLWAAARFDPDRGARFSTYAIPFVLGALKELCRRSAPMHIPRGELRVLCAAMTVRDDLRRRDGREPSMNEISEHVGVQPEKLASMLQAQERMTTLSTNEITLAPDGTEGFEEWVLVKDAVRSLGKPYAQILWLRYFAGYSQSDIAKKYGISQSQASKWEKRGKDMLRAGLARC